MSKNKVYIVGVSPEGARGLSASALRVLRQAEVVYGGSRLLKMFSLPDVEKITIGNNIAGLAASIKSGLGLKRMAVLASGDPGFFGIAKFLGEKLGKDTIEIIPNVSSVQLAFARLKENWEDAEFVSAHARPIQSIIEKVRRSAKIAILTDNKNTPLLISAALAEAGICDGRVYICQDLGTDKERVISASLGEVKNLRLSPLNIMVLIRDRDPDTRTSHQLLGITEDEFHQRKGQSLITKHEIRAVSLAKLRLTDSSVLWDIGSGSGAVSIEASLLAANGSVFAIEKSSADTAIIRRNVAKFGRHNIKVIRGSAPSCLSKLPDPSVVFVGGSSGRIASILDCACLRLGPGGRIVCNLATLENVHSASARLKANGYSVEITMINVARSRDIAGLTRLEPLNPVFVVTGSRSEKEVGNKKKQ